MNLSAALNPGEYCLSPSLTLGHSAFNPVWLPQLGITDPKLIIDVGGYDGGDAIRFKSHFPEARVVCFEADTTRADIIKTYAAQYGVEFHHYAVTNHNGGVVPIYPSRCDLKDAGSTHRAGEIGGQGSLFQHTKKYKDNYPHIRQHSTIEFVYAISLLEYCHNIDYYNIDLLHVDAEGSEYKVVKGLGEIIRPKLIYVETLEGMFEGVETTDQLHSLLQNMGYSLVLNITSDRLYKHFSLPG